MAGVEEGSLVETLGPEAEIGGWVGLVAVGLLTSCSGIGVSLDVATVGLFLSTGGPGILLGSALGPALLLVSVLTLKSDVGGFARFDFDAFLRDALGSLGGIFDMLI